MVNRGKVYKNAEEIRQQYNRDCKVPNFHMYGRVVQCDAPRITGGFDMKLGLTLTDSTGSITRVNIFCSSFPGLSRSEDCVGTVARVHNVRMTHPTLDMATCAHQSGGSFLLIRDTDTEPFFVSASHFQTEPLDWTIINELRNLNAQPQRAPAALTTRDRGQQYFQGNPQYMKKLSEVPSLDMDHFDLQCKLLHIHRVEGGRIDHIHVWDGTDVDPAVIASTAHELSPALQKPFGSIVKVRFEIDNRAVIFDTQEWVALRNLGVYRSPNGTVQLYFRQLTRFWKLDRTAEAALDREVAQTSHEFNLITPVTSSPVATCSHPKVPASCITSIQRTIIATPFSKWRVFARVKQIQPSDPHAAIQLWCARCHHATIPSSGDIDVDGVCADDVQDVCSQCGRPDDCQYEFSFVLLLADSTGELPVIVNGKHAEHLLSPLQACNLAHAAQNVTRQRMHDVFDALTDPAAWIDVALTTAHTNEEQREATGLRYVARLIDTQIDGKLLS